MRAGELQDGFAGRLQYVRDMLIRMQHHVAADVDELLPWNWVPPDENPDAPP
jgi:hypothetical protein